MAARLNHPNAVAVYEIGRKGTVYFIAMELVSGASGTGTARQRKEDGLEAGDARDDRRVQRPVGRPRCGDDSSRYQAEQSALDRG